MAEKPVGFYRRNEDTIQFLIGLAITTVLSSAVPILFIGSFLSIILYFIVRVGHPRMGTGMGWGIPMGFLGALFVCAKIITSGIK